jgi:hypothetical protein
VIIIRVSNLYLQAVGIASCSVSQSGTHVARSDTADKNVDHRCSQAKHEINDDFRRNPLKIFELRQLFGFIRVMKVRLLQALLKPSTQI